AIPTVSSSNKQLIGQYNGYTNGTITVEFTFNANADYAQLWIYPQATSNNEYQLGVSRVNVCPYCSGTIVYNSGTVPTGTTNSGRIDAGSSAGSGGSGTVTVLGTANTTFQAIDEINLVYDFNASVTSGSFSAEIVSCNGLFREDTIEDSSDIELPDVGESEIDDQGSVAAKQINGSYRAKPLGGFVKVYPTVGSGIINIENNFQKDE